MNGQSCRFWPFGAVENKCLLAAPSCRCVLAGSARLNLVFFCIIELAIGISNATIHRFLIPRSLILLFEFDPAAPYIPIANKESLAELCAVGA